MKKEYVIVSTDRHRDDLVYLFKGTYEEAKKRAKELLFGIRDYEFEENEYNDGGLLYNISMGDGDYSSTIYEPIREFAKSEEKEL